MLIYDPIKRPTAQQVLQHPFFKNEPKPCKPLSRFLLN